MESTFKVTSQKKIKLSDYDPSDTHGNSADEVEKRMIGLNKRLTALQEMHYAAGQNGILIILQGLDAAGKDGTIKHVMAQFNPAGCRVEPFKVPTPDELAHDFLWRYHRVTPPRGYVSIFNRSYYEDVLVVRVHKLVPKSVWKDRFEHINNFEALLAANGTVVLKFFLYISKDEQRQRLLAREQEKDKAWKLSITDWSEHELYGDYVAAYEDALSRCSTESAPWHIVPANDKWYRNYAVARTIVDTLDPLAAQWKDDVQRRGEANLKAIAAQRASSGQAK